MSLFKKITLFRASLGHMGSMEKTHIDTFTEEKINNISGSKLAGIDPFGIWYTLKELAGYTFLEISVLSKVNIKTFKGCELAFLGGDLEMHLKTDLKEISSDFSNISNRWLTKMSFILSKEDLDFLEKKEYQHLRILHKKITIDFKVIPDQQ